ncbi:MAG: rRNA maturation RNase YbeY [Candidatus Magasanikbacteria bacterium]|nr:rRNA maturation RNase YbeY [Candidatus Magasanikbacteria bacterium]
MKKVAISVYNKKKEGNTCTVYQTVRYIGISKKTVQHVVQSVLHSLRIHGDVSVHYIGTKKMQTLNYRFRGKNRPTDVLSFAAQEGESLPGFSHHDLGDIFICVPYIQAQARSYGISYTEESLRMLIHGVLHILGYDHEKTRDAKVMFALQEKFLSEHVRIQDRSFS